MKSVWFRIVLPVCLLATIVFICFARTLSSYFLADDFSEVNYVANIFHGGYKALLADFAGNHMQTSVMKVYRPGATLALLFNYAICRTNAWGYFLINILVLLASCVMFYLLLRELTRSWEHRRSILFAILSAALFAANPLHCEPVSFISSGDYVISAFFYLAALWCFVKNAGAIRGKFLALGVALFWAAVLCKEAAVGFAVALSGVAFFLPGTFSPAGGNRQTVITESDASGAQVKQARYSLGARLKTAIVISMPVWLSTIVYLSLRLAVLGTVTGGYTAGLGSTLTSSLVQRLTNLDTILRIVYPLNTSVFGTGSIYGSILFTLYVVLGTCIVLKVILRHVSWEWLGLLSVWALSTAAPLYQVWSMGADLEGGRFFFFLTIPLSVLLPAALLAPPEVQATSSAPADAASSTATEQRAINAVAVIALVALVMTDTAITYNNNIPWVHAGRQTKACLIQGRKLAQSVPAGKRVALLGLPQEFKGAHVIYNGATFNIMMSPPFSKQNYADKFITFDPLFYGSPAYVNAQRLKDVLQDPTMVGLYSWNSKLHKFELLKNYKQPGSPETEAAVLSGKPMFSQTCGAADSQSQLWMQQNAHTYSLIVAPLNLDPFQYDFIEITLKSNFPKLPVRLYWEGAKPGQWCESKYPAQAIISTGPGGVSNIILRVSDHWCWYTQGNISKLKLEFLSGQNFELLSIRALPAKLLIPSITLPGLKASNLGVYPVSKSGVDVNFDGSRVDGCVAVKIEASKPNYFFEGLAASEDKAAIMTSFIVPVKNGHTHIPCSIFSSSGYYQLRAVCLNAGGCQIGEASDPVTIGI